jgi:hypothetical protein
MRLSPLTSYHELLNRPVRERSRQSYENAPTIAGRRLWVVCQAIDSFRRTKGSQDCANTVCAATICAQPEGGPMSLQKIKSFIAENKLVCPTCHKPVRKWEKYVDLMDSAYDGPGSSLDDEPSGASKVTLICGNDGCSWSDRTEYWMNYFVE